MRNSQYFDVRDEDEYEENWQNNISSTSDGNAFQAAVSIPSCQSRSVTFKLAMFREWMKSGVKPWVHYVPLSVQATEHLGVAIFRARG